MKHSAHLKRLMHSILATLVALTAIVLATACSNSKREYTIGVSQCSEDSWRTKLHDELDMATYFNEGITLRYAASNDDADLQEKQINEMIDAGVDLLIVSPQQIGELSEAVDRAYDAGIPVVLYDRKTNSEKYTAYIGADNYLIGSMLADYAAEQLEGEGCIVEIGGFKASSPAIDRKRGFREGLKKYPGLKIVASADGDWTEASGERAMENILKTYDGNIDCVFGGNDRMAIGARKALSRTKSATYVSHIKFLGVDALPNEGAGMCQVRDGILTASAIYPTHGDEVMQVAIDILEGRKFEHENLLASSIVTADNARVLLLQHEEVVRQGDYLRRMHKRVDNTLHKVNVQRLIIFFFVLLFVLSLLSIIYVVRAYRQKHRLNQVLAEKNQLLGKQRDELREQRDTLQEQHDQLCEQRDQLESQRDELAMQRDILQRLRPELQKNPEDTVSHLATSADEPLESSLGANGASELYSRILELIERNISNSEFSVEHLSDACGLSRAQLYRRCKQITGNSPVELLRNLRMQRAGQMLSSSDRNISEVTYACGFTSPSYFTKCFKEHYGMSPTDFVRLHYNNKHNPTS